MMRGLSLNGRVAHFKHLLLSDSQAHERRERTGVPVRSHPTQYPVFWLNRSVDLHRAATPWSQESQEPGKHGKPGPRSGGGDASVVTLARQARWPTLLHLTSPAHLFPFTAVRLSAPP
jgi:hypothetical protein